MTIQDPLARLIYEHVTKGTATCGGFDANDLAAEIRRAQVCENCQNRNGQPCSCADDVDEPWGYAPGGGRGW